MAEPWEMEDVSSSSNTTEAEEKLRSTEQRVAYLKSHLAPGAPKVGASGNTSDMNQAADKAVDEAQDTENFDERWKKVQYQAKSYRGLNTDDDADQKDNIGVDDNDVLWQSALNRFEQEQETTPITSDQDYPPNLSQLQQNNSEDEEYARRLQEEMDVMGGVESMEIEQSPPAIRDHLTNDESLDLEKLTLWQTLKVLWKRNVMLKFYFLGLIILLGATAAIIGVTLSQNKSSSSNDCDTASYLDAPYLLLPESQSTYKPGGFGMSLSASSDYLVVGAPKPACIPQKDSCNDFTVGGAAYLYKRNNDNEWATYSSFVLDDGISTGDLFGSSVAIDSDSTTVVVGSPQDDGLGPVAGAAYVMEYPFSSTTPGSRLVSDDIGVKDDFGGSVSVSATTVGTNKEIRVTNIAVGASKDDEYGLSSGSVYVFSKYDDEPPVSACGGDKKIEVGKWIQCQKLLPDDGAGNDQFGRAVDIQDRTLVVGAMWNDHKGIDSGAAYVYSLGDDGSWTLQQKLASTNFQAQADRFGHSVATSGDRIVVGADLDNSKGMDSGAAYLYSLANGAWSPEAKLVVPGDVDHREYTCGFSVDISTDGTMAVVGCPGAPGGGASYGYNLRNGEWIQTEIFSAPDGYGISSGLRLGSSVTTSSGNDGMAIIGYGEFNGEIYSYRKDC